MWSSLASCRECLDAFQQLVNQFDSDGPCSAGNATAAGHSELEKEVQKGIARHAILQRTITGGEVTRECCDIMQKRVDLVFCCHN